MMGNVKSNLAILALVLASASNADIPKYYGYDWIDPYPTTATVAYSNIKDHTNLNVVHTIAALNSSACNNGGCVLGISAGQSDVYVDICPNKTTDETCSAVGYGNIWNIISSVKAATNKPTAIYFIDEPFYEAALKSNNVYVTYRYSSYICTLNDAMSAYSLKIPIFTILAENQYRNPDYRSEINNGIPVTGCPATIKSTVDWIGIDNYTWTNKQQVIDAYNLLDPTKKFKWVMVPASSYDVANNAYMIGFYKEAAEIANNFVYIMNFKYDNRVVTGSGQLADTVRSFGMYIKNLHK